MPFAQLFNPFTLAVMTVITIGVIVYEFASQQREKKMPTGRRPRQSSSSNPPDSPPRPPRMRTRSPLNHPSKPSDRGPRKPPNSSEPNSAFGNKGSEESPVSPEILGRHGNEYSERNIRNRKRDHAKPEPHTRKHDTNCEVDSKISSSTKGTSYTFNENINMKGKMNDDNTIRDKDYDEKNYEKNVLDKISNDISQKGEKKKNMVKNISDEDSDSSENNVPVKAKETKLINTSISDQSVQNQNNEVGACLMNDKMSRGGISYLDNEEEIYKKKVCDAIKKDVEDIDQCNDSKEVQEEVNPMEIDNACNSIDVTEDKQIKVISSNEVPALCRSCEEEPANALAYPCKHCCLCLECALKVHRIFNKCCICDNVVEKYVTLEK